MNTFYYTTTYTNKSTLNQVPDEIIKMFGDTSTDQIDKLLPDNIVGIAAEIKQQREQAIRMRQYMEKQTAEKS